MEHWTSLVLGAVAMLIVLVVLKWRFSRNPVRASVPQNGSSGRRLSVRRRFLSLGSDNRLSTSQWVLITWTFVVGWLVVTSVFVSGGDANAFEGQMAGFGLPYFAVLGGPVLAAVLARASTQAKTSGADPQLQKTDASGPSLGDLVQNDSGQVSVNDTQYFVLNVCVMLYVIVVFAMHADHVPAIPEQLAFLTGGSAATYVGTKSVVMNRPTITAVSPTRVTTAGDIRIVIQGSDLVAPGEQVVTESGDQKPVKETTRVDINGLAVPQASIKATPSSVVVTALPDGLNAGTYDIRVITGAGVTATATGENALTIM